MINKKSLFLPVCLFLPLAAIACGGDNSGGGGGSAGTSMGAGRGGSGGSMAGGAGAGGSAGTAGEGGSGGTGGETGGGAIQTVFVILMENHNWSQVKTAPFISALQQMGAHAEQYFNPPGIHPSEPNYVWLEAGTNALPDHVFKNDDDASARNSTASHDHLAALLDKASIPWKAYQENIGGNECPLASSGGYAAKHNPFVFFQDMTGNNTKTDPTCIQHMRPYPELAHDLSTDQVARYNFITPNLIDDMHDGTVMQGDTWLRTNVTMIMASEAYKEGGAIFITWDEGEGGDGPIGMIVVSPVAKPGFTSMTHFDHSSMVLTIEKIFGLTPLLGKAADPATHDLGELFMTFP